MSESLHIRGRSPGCPFSPSSQPGQPSQQANFFSSTPSHLSLQARPSIQSSARRERRSGWWRKAIVQPNRPNPTRRGQLGSSGELHRAMTSWRIPSTTVTTGRGPAWALAIIAMPGMPCRLPVCLSACQNGHPQPQPQPDAPMGRREACAVCRRFCKRARPRSTSSAPKPWVRNPPCPSRGEAEGALARAVRPAATT